MDQWWRLWHRTGHRWIEKCNMNVLIAIRERVLSWAGHVARMDYSEICAKALRSRGLQWWRRRQHHWKEVEKDKWSGPHPKRFKLYRWEDMVSTEVSKFAGSADGFPESVQLSTGWLQFAQDRGLWRQFPKFGKKSSLGVANVRTQWRCTSCLVGPSAPDMLVGCSLLMVSLGVERWWWWRRLASLGVEWWSWLRGLKTGRITNHHLVLKMFSLSRVKRWL